FRKFLRLKQRHVLGFRSGEWMMHRVPFIVFSAPFEERKIHDPKEIPLRRAGVRAGLALSRPTEQILHLCDTQTQSAKNFTGDFPFISSKKDAVTLLDVQLRLQPGLLGVTEELHDGRFPFTVLNLDKGETLGAVQLCNFRELIGLAYGDSGKAFCIDCFHNAAASERAPKNLEPAFTKGLPEINQLHFEPAIGLNAAVAIERFTISKPVEWRFDLNIARRFENRRKHCFRQREDIVRRDE